MVLDVFEIGFHRPRMLPLIGHEIMKFFSWVVTSIIAGVKLSVPGALSECALLYPVIDIVAETTITVFYVK
jgi:hypothetical protein